MKKLLVILCLLIGPMAMGQKTDGVVTYVRKEHWLKIINRLPFLSQEQKDRESQTWKNFEENNKGIKMKLAFSPNESLYTYFSDEPEEGGYSWRKSEFLLYRNFEKEKRPTSSKCSVKPTLLTIPYTHQSGKLATRSKKLRVTSA